MIYINKEKAILKDKFDLNDSEISIIQKFSFKKAYKETDKKTY